MNWIMELYILLMFFILRSYAKAEHSSLLTTTKFQEIPDFDGVIKNVTIAIGREAVLSCSVTDLGHYKDYENRLSNPHGFYIFQVGGVEDSTFINRLKFGGYEVGWMKADDQTILSLHTRVITHNPRISVAHDDSLKTWQLRIRQLKESDRGCYMCQINTSQMKKQVGCIDVQVPPDIDDSETSGDVTISEGENVTLSCSATGHPEPRILWRREDGNHITQHVSSRETQKVDTYSGSVLNLLHIDRYQMGSYLCIASNDVPPAVSKRVTLFVNFPPIIQVAKPLVGSPQTFNVKLRCEVESFPTSHNYWLKERDEILLEGGKYTIVEKRSGTKCAMILTILNVSPEDYASYTCVASNIKGKSDATIRLYEIVLTTTTTTTTTTPATTITNLILEITRSSERPSISMSNFIGGPNAEDVRHPEWFYPSVAPEPLELETISGMSPSLQITSHYHIITLSILFALR